MSNEQVEAQEKAVEEPPRKVKRYTPPCTNDTLQARVDTMEGLLTKCISRSQIMKEFRAIHGESLSWRTVDVYMVRARKRMSREAAQPSAELRAQRIAQLKEIIKTSTNENARVRAFDLLCEIEGLKVHKVEVTSTTTHRHSLDLTVLPPEKLKELRDSIRLLSNPSQVVDVETDKT